MMKRLPAIACSIAAVLALAACGEREQVPTARKPDANPWQGANPAFVTGNWSVGDKASWEEQLRTRAAVTQNEYTRTK